MCDCVCLSLSAEVLLAASRDYALAGDAAVVTLRESVEPIPGFPMRRRNRRNPYALVCGYTLQKGWLPLLLLPHGSGPEVVMTHES